MTRMAFIVALCCMCAGPFAARASPITPNWDKLTDFSTDVHITGEHIIAAINSQQKARHAPQFPLKEIDAHGKIHVDVGGERLKIKMEGHETFRNAHGLWNLPPDARVLAGAEVTGSSEIVFNAPAGFVAVKEHGTIVSPTLGTWDLEYCVKLNFPQGLLPPPQAVQSELTHRESLIDQHMAQHPIPHQDVMVDGNSMALIRAGPTWDPLYVGILHDGTPVGAGIVPPENGAWNPAIKFTHWKEGAGAVHEFPCGSMSAAEFLAKPHANETLAVFDQMMASMQRMELLRETLVHFPAQPSLLFKSAAANELSAASDAMHPVPQASMTLPMVAGAVAAGALGSILVIAVLKATVKSSRREPLLADIA